MEYITVKVAKLGTVTKEVTLSAGATVKDALEAAGINVDNNGIHVNGSEGDLTTILGNNDTVTLTPNMKVG